jgi:hypothetical protein
VYKGLANYRDIIQAEASGDFIERIPSADEERGEILVMGEFIEAQRGSRLTSTVSATDKTRDQVRSVVRDFLNEKVTMSELEYQPH